jgi:hypothetical protein
VADDINSFNKQIGQLPIKLKRQLATAIAQEADRLATAIFLLRSMAVASSKSSPSGGDRLA